MQPFEVGLTMLDPHSHGITFLVGENGCGKSRNLVELEKQARERNQPVLPISNIFTIGFPGLEGLIANWREIFVTSFLGVPFNRR